MEFDSFYAEYFGTRWPVLRAALVTEEAQVLRPCFSGLEAGGIGVAQPATVQAKAKLNERNDQGKLIYYAMDPASILAAKAVGVSEGDRVLDMCAAPGGKTLVMLETIGSGNLVANELSTPRRNRLKKVIQQYVPDMLRPHVEVRGKDGIRYGVEQPAAYDRVLLDAPCSSERHLLHQGDKKELMAWSANRSKRLAKKQFGLLSSAYLAVRPGGTFVYCTCSLSPFENDAVVAKLLRRHSENLDIEFDPRLESQGGEKTSVGIQFLPDRSGFGPLYFSVIRKRNAE